MLGERGFRFHWVTAAIQSLKCLNIQHKHLFTDLFIQHSQSYVLYLLLVHEYGTMTLGFEMTFYQKALWLIKTLGNCACIDLSVQISTWIHATRVCKVWEGVLPVSECVYPGSCSVYLNRGEGYFLWYCWHSTVGCWPAGQLSLNCCQTGFAK